VCICRYELVAKQRINTYMSSTPHFLGRLIWNKGKTDNKKYQVLCS